MNLSNKSVLKICKTKTWTIPESGIHVCTSDLTECKHNCCQCCWYILEINSKVIFTWSSITFAVSVIQVGLLYCQVSYPCWSAPCWIVESGMTLNGWLQCFCPTFIHFLYWPWPGPLNCLELVLLLIFLLSLSVRTLHKNRIMSLCKIKNSLIQL